MVKLSFDISSKTEAQHFKDGDQYALVKANTMVREVVPEPVTSSVSLGEPDSEAQARSIDDIYHLDYILIIYDTLF